MLHGAQRFKCIVRRARCLRNMAPTVEQEAAPAAPLYSRTDFEHHEDARVPAPELPGRNGFPAPQTA